MKLRIYRFDPDTDSRPRMQDFDVQPGPTDRMLLDLLMRVRQVDDSVSFRRSCREGVCGSDAMNINGRNGLACIQPLASLKEPVVLRPLPGFPVVRDLIVDMTQFFKQYHSIKPYLVNNDPAPERERLQKEASELVQQIERLTTLLNGPFSEKAPAAVVQKERDKLAGLEAGRKEIQERLSALQQS